MWSKSSLLAPINVYNNVCVCECVFDYHSFIHLDHRTKAGKAFLVWKSEIRVRLFSSSSQQENNKVIKGSLGLMFPEEWHRQLIGTVLKYVAGLCLMEGEEKKSRPVQ